MDKPKMIFRTYTFLAMTLIVLTLRASLTFWVWLNEIEHLSSVLAYESNCQAEITKPASPTQHHPWQIKLIICDHWHPQTQLKLAIHTSKYLGNLGKRFSFKLSAYNTIDPKFLLQTQPLSMAATGLITHIYLKAKTPIKSELNPSWWLPLYSLHQVIQRF